MSSTKTPNRKQDTSAQRNLSVRVLLLVSFIEGACVMIIELLGARIIAPWFGTSLYVWASVLGVTLISLALGYFLGGRLSSGDRLEKKLFIVLATGALFTILSPITGPFFMKAMSGYGVRTGSFLSVLLYLLPPLTCMGIVSPLITQLINRNEHQAGLSAGTVFSISTLGGIVATFLAGFYLIPELGIRMSAFLTGGIMMLVACWGLIFTRNTLMALATIMACSLAAFSAPTYKKQAGDIRIKYQSSGILGEWTVVDEDEMVEYGEKPTFRRLLLNGIVQTNTQVGYEPISIWSYPHKIAALAGIKPAGSKALLLGMGGGSIAVNLKRLGFETDIVELDERIGYIASTWFGYEPSKYNLVFDDGRHYINQCRKTYDLVVIDLLNGEVQPGHIFTREGFNALQKVMRPDGLVIINFQGSFSMNDPALSMAPRSIYKTLVSCGYKADFCEKVEEGASATSGDLLIFGTPGNLDYSSLLKKDLRYNKIDSLETFTWKDYLDHPQLSLEDAVVLTDDKPNLELLNAETILEWRMKRIAATEAMFTHNKLQLFR